MHVTARRPKYRVSGLGWLGQPHAWELSFRTDSVLSGLRFTSLTAEREQSLAGRNSLEAFPAPVFPLSIPAEGFPGVWATAGP